MPCLSCFSRPTTTNNSSSLTNNTVYTDIGPFCEQQRVLKADKIVKRSKRSTKRLQQSQESVNSTKYDNIETLLELYPWYHGKIDRQDAEMVVLGLHGETEDGTFIVRKSLTRIGQHVITFNNKAQATHMQFSFDYGGQCKLKGQWFITVFDMLEYFRTHPIPLESAKHKDATLTGFISNLDVVELQ